MKKVGVVVLLFLISLAIVSAQNNTIEEKAFSCLQNKLGDNCGSGSVEQLAFSLLAMSGNSGIQQDCKSALLDKQKSDNSFGTIKETSLATIALDYINTNTDDEQDYLLSKKQKTNLEWYLEIDLPVQGKCTVTGGASITINENKKLSGNTGTCFSFAYDNYWLKIADNCIDKKLEVSCDKDFLSTIIYKKPGSNVWHVSSDVKEASSGGKTEHTINASCFSSGAGCDYEGSLWATLAFKATGNDISSFTPYLTAFSEDNARFFPETFLYIFASSSEYLTSISTLQKTDGFWKLNTNEYYDTALALLALSGAEPTSLAIAWLERAQGNDGCWNNGNIRDTSFLLWATFPKIPSTPGRTQDNCADFDYYCITQGECEEVNGQTLTNFYCPGLKICCDSPPLNKSCADKDGQICSSGYKCKGTETSTSDTNKCCIGTCELEESECEQLDYTCRVNCLDNEESVLYDCPSGQICCKEQGAKSLWWIWLLVILIILVVLGIIFRNKLRLFFFKIRNKFRKGSVAKTRPPFPPPGVAVRRMFPGRPVRMAPTPVKRVGTQIKRASTKTDKELEETLKKLREMSK